MIGHRRETGFNVRLAASVVLAAAVAHLSARIGNGPRHTPGA